MRYDAFISYRHSELDMEIAKKIHKGLETYKVPGSVKRKTGKKKIARVFRDQEELPIGSDLGNNITSALENSEWLIVICSPRLPKSYWCLTEIETFIKMHDRNHVLAVLIEGEPDESFPEILLKDENGNPVEPLAADVRGDNKKERNQKFKTELIRLCAPLLGVSYDDLRQRHRERAMRKYTAIAGAVAVAGVAFGVYNAYNLARINENYQAKLENESKTLARTSKEILETGDRETAALVAMKGLPIDEDRPYVPDCEYALSEALGVYENGTSMTKDKVLTHNLKIDSYTVNEDGTRVLSNDYLNYTYLWDVESGKLLFNLQPDYVEGKPASIRSMKYYDEKAYIVDDYSVKVLNDKGELLSKIEVPGYNYNGKLSDDCSLTIYCSGSVFNVYDTENGNLVYSIEEPFNVSYGDEGKNADLSYSLKSCFSKDNRYVISVMSSIVVPDSYIRIMDLETGETNVVKIDNQSVSDLYFLPDNHFVALSYSEMDIYNFNSEKDFTLNCFDAATAESVWSTSVKSSSSSYGTGYFNFADRSYTDDEGIAHDELFLSLYRYLYTIDKNTGEVTSLITVSDDIENYFINPKNAYGYLGLYSGNVEFVNLTEGKLYSEQTIDLADSLTDFQVKGGKAFVKSVYANNLLVASFSSGTSAELILEDSDFFDYTACSPDGDTLAVGFKTDNDQIDFKVISIEDGSSLGKFTIDASYLEDALYFDSDTIILYDTYNNVYYYTISNGKLDSYRLCESKYSGNVYRSEDNKHIINWRAGYYDFMDLETREIKSSIVADYLYSMTGFLPNSADYFYLTNDLYELYRVDIRTGKEEQLLMDYSIDTVVLNNDNSMMVCVCCDGMLRIFNTEDFSLADEFTFYASHSTGNIKFIGDTSKLLCQGADYILHIYDLETKDFVYTSSEQYNIINMFTYNEATNTLGLRNYNGILMLDLNNYGLKGCVPGGLFYFPDKETIISKANNNKLFKFQYYDYKELVELAKELYPDAELTDAQKLIYNIE